MAETLQTSRFGYELSDADEQILRSLDQERLPIEQVVEQAELERSTAVSSITNLISAGYLELVVIAYPWGVEFSLQPTSRVTIHSPGKQN